MMKFQCSFLALFIKNCASPFRIDSMRFEAACFMSAAQTLEFFPFPGSLPPCSVSEGYRFSLPVLQAVLHIQLGGMVLSLSFGVP